ncbi:MAG: hypothetical protein IPM92_12060 [Saprospiraceae bacterium]|nr:hypothetical protein [Saprospiraceae bacterium]
MAIEIKLIKFDKIQFSYKDTDETLIYKNINIKIDFNFLYILNDNNLHVKFHLIYDYKSDELELPELITLSFITVYNIRNIEEVYDHELKKLKLDQKLILTLLTMIIGTARGILVVKQKETYLSDLYLPFIQADQIYNQMKEGIEVKE